MYKKIFLSLFIATMVLVAIPNVSSASTISELQAQIASLMAQVQQLQAQLTAQVQGGGTTVWCHTFNIDMGIGYTGDTELGALRQTLHTEGFAPYTSQGVGGFAFDETVASWVTQFQEKYRNDILTPAGLSAGTGDVGPRTRAKLNALYGCGNVNPTPTPIACTMEAFVCPDGSSVGRDSLNNCQFKACPNQLSSPVISGVSGPQSLNVNQQGTWTVTAYDAKAGSGNLSYSVNWGDEGLFATNTNSANAMSLPQQSATFTHTYSQAGNYTPRFTVTSENGQSAQTSLSVNVGGGVTTNSIQVLSPNGGEQWVINQAFNILWSVGDTDPNKTVTLILIPDGLNCSDPSNSINCWTIAANASNTGNFTWANAGRSFYTGPAPSAPAGRYKIGVIYDKNNCPRTSSGTYSASCYDESDNAFTFVSTTVAQPSPSIHLTGSSGSQSSDTFLIINKGSQVVISGVPMNLNLAGNDFTRSFFFDPIFNGSCGNNSATDRTWTMTCAANSAGSSRFYVEIYQNGQTYRSNVVTLNVLVPEKTCSDLKTSQSYFFSTCSASGFNNVCFNKFSGEYQGCMNNNDCTVNNTYASQNIICPVY